jgi:hypothetical protein
MAFMIVGLHAGFLGEYTKLGHYLTVNGVFRVAVPVFLIINGFYFYPVLLKNLPFYMLSGCYFMRISGFQFLSFLLLVSPNSQKISSSDTITYGISQE